MALAVWPPEIGPPMVNYGLEDNEILERVQMAQGNPRVRVTSLSPQGATITQSFEMDATQVQIYRRFKRDDIANGADWFLMPIWVASAFVNHEVQISGNTRYEYVTDDNQRVHVPVITRDDLADDV